jgi:hypothetical protein
LAGDDQVEGDVSRSSRSMWPGARRLGEGGRLVHLLDVMNVWRGPYIAVLAVVASGSLLAPALGHVLMHIAGITRGVELPPHEHVGHAVGV